jgi:hypothetical protein
MATAAAATSARRAWPAWANATTLVGLLLGGVVVPLVGWLVSGAVLWWSPTWTHREKLLGTLVLPGGLMAMFYASLQVSPRECSGAYRLLPSGGWSGAQTCTAGTSSGVTLALFCLLAAPIASMIYLWVKARGRQA